MTTASTTLSTREAGATAAGVLCLGGIAASHLADLQDKLDEAHYMAVMFIGLITASVILAAALLAGYRTREAWRIGAVLSALTILGYVLSRSVGLPQLEDHVGMWLDPWGVVALVSEAAFIALALRRG